ncbi:xanthine dehydrogenase YagR molybdenum-binding subunit [Pseudoxanthobacter soli DSM 19599]|uniref:Xanthine dehydrogenase YagR molybdenum-binding subunit n=1 Tax=Pseudoxanthobacter soli DSM 19599 TaxID=1123029 RepID=A0A1M7ZNB7_9HYPH|nr:aldehyde oxidoreductase molybdenum-binding subunit PaoC [Pseudoxanthobacter soli]SHO66400.1 xanthine dehydrogenase YagR molybdenum-binding subunit [Pseudoxanthobacter soli DSM 19599]
MKFERAAQANPADRMAVIGRPVRRVEGPLKVTGRAPYAYERHDVVKDPLVGYPVAAGIAKGRIRAIDASDARNAPGVVTIVTALDMDALPKDDKNIVPLFGGRAVEHYHQAVAVVVAGTFEQARAAAGLVRVEYEAEPAQFDLHAAYADLNRDEAEPDAAVGDFAGAFAAAPVTLDETYTTPCQSHAMMEPHATMAAWQDGRLTVWTSNQMVAWNRSALATTLGLSEDDVRVVTPYIGGGFGAKLFLRADAVLAALAAREAGRPVKVALPRDMVFNNTTHRAATIQRIRIGATADGRITAIAHENTSNAPPDGKGEDATLQTHAFYAGPNRLIVNRIATLHLPESNSMRAPGDAAGQMALEIAMDEMAERLGMDPVAFRIVNDTQVHPQDATRRFSQRRFVECLRTGAEAFGWPDRNRAPGATRHGDWLIGHGVAGAYRGAPATTSGARVRLQPDGSLIVETDMTDIGTGSYTIIAQTASEMTGVAIADVDVRLGDSRYPVSSGSGGQFGACSSTAGVYAACVALRNEIAQRLQADPETVTFADGTVRTAEGGVHPLSALAAAGEIVAEDRIEFGDFRDTFELATFGAHFVEVGVHAATGEIRVRRMLAVCDAGRILNPVTARSQVIGAMTMGVGAALMEELAVDEKRGFFVNHDLALYEVPVHADIPTQDVIFLDGADAVSSPLKAKGVGELGLCGVAAAIANAVFNATGIRVRDYPVTLDKLIDRLPAV